MTGLRASYDVLPRELYLKAGKGAEILYWDKNTKFCGVCGAPMKLHTDISKRCTNCGKEVWPQLATAIIVLVRRGDSILLVHAHNLRGKYYGLVAGFVETGETLEECVRRELMEETGVTVKNIRYFGSQPWPYPCGLMIGFMRTMWRETYICNVAKSHTAVGLIVTNCRTYPERSPWHAC